MHQVIGKIPQNLIGNIPTKLNRKLNPHHWYRGGQNDSNCFVTFACETWPDLPSAVHLASKGIESPF